MSKDELLNLIVHTLNDEDGVAKVSCTVFGRDDAIEVEMTDDTNWLLVLQS